MSMAYIRKAYGVPAKRGMWVKYTNHAGHVVRGKIISATHHLCVQFIGNLGRSFLHPKDENLVYCGMEIPEAQA